MRADGSIVQLSDDLKLDRQMRHHIEVVIDRLTMSASVRSRLAEAVELALRMGEGTLVVALEEGPGGSNAKLPVEADEENHSDEPGTGRASGTRSETGRASGTGRRVGERVAHSVRSGRQSRTTATWCFRRNMRVRIVD